MEEFFGIKELYDINFRVKQPIQVGDKKYDINESVFTLKSAEFSNLSQRINTSIAKGGYHNNALIFWETDKEMQFSLSHGILSPISWALLSNSQLYSKNSKSVAYNETLQVIEDNDYCYIDLKFNPNACQCLFGVQGNPNNEPLPLGRRPELMLKPLPPKRDKYIFIYDLETGKKISDFEIYQNRIFFKSRYRKVYVDYTFEFKGEIQLLKVGERLFNNFLSMNAKTTVKSEKNGIVYSGVIEIPKIKITSNLSVNLGKNCENSIVSDFIFTGYPDENIRREKQSVCSITFLNKELTGDYI